jgi:Rad3-related DNA helicase
MDIDTFELKPPYRFFSLQKRYVTDIAKTIESKKVLLVEAGTGFGKTLANLFAVLNFSKKTKIVYLSKTHQQNQQVIHELEKLNQINYKNLVTGLQLASRKQLCHIEHVAEAYPSAAISMCRHYQKMRKKDQRYSRCISCTDNKEKISLPIVLTIDSLRDLAKNHSGCAYLTARALLNDFDVITGHYNYYLSPEIRQAIGVEETKPILILDEGHNLEDVLTSLYSNDISHYTLNSAIKEVKGVDYKLFNLIDFFSSSLNHLVKTHGRLGESVIFKGNEMISLFDSFGINKNRIQKLRKRFKLVFDAIIDHQKQESGKYSNQLAVEEILDFLEIKSSSRDFGYIILRLPKGFRIRKECLNPAMAFNEVRQIAKSIIICSGTLSPIPLWKEILGIRNEDVITAKYGSLTDPRKVKVIAFATDKYGNKLTTKYSHRINNPDVYTYYFNSIVELIQTKFSGGILVFVPSYNFIEKLSFPSHINDIKCFQEEPDAKKNLKLVQVYKNTIINGNRALFIGVLGGKLSEGTDLPHDLVRMVIILGIPYPPPNDPVIKLKREYYDTMRKGLGTDWYNALAFRKISQAIGRGWRTSTDFSIGILLDERLTFSSAIEKLPLWIKNSLSVASSWNDGLNSINKFEQTLKKIK